jgi:hypothetical protein
MNSIWGTIGTILATGVVMVLGYWAQHYWMGKREIKGAKRKYRESVVAPIREALGKIQANLVWRDYIDKIINAEKYGISLKPETLKDREMLEELQQRREARNMRVTLTELLPLAAAITNEEARKAVEQALVGSVLTKETKEVLGMEEQDVKQLVKLAYQKLEDFVTLAD